MAIRPLHDSILFVFTDATAGGNFIPLTKSGILMTNQNFDESKTPKWGKVLAVGPECKDTKIGDFALFEPLQWTTGFTVDNIKIWKSDETKVLAVTNDVESTFQY